VIRSTTFSSPTRKYTYDQHVDKFEDTYNELALLGEPVPKQSKVRLFCKSLKEKFMKAAAIDTQMSEKTGLNFEMATAHLKSVRDLHITDFAKKGEERYIGELGLEPRKRKGGGDGPQDKRKKKGGGAGGAGGSLQLHGYSNQEWRALPEATKAKVNAGRAMEKAAKRAASTASSSQAG
jgi:DNA-binding transcriptional ArsR family regulator